MPTRKQILETIKPYKVNEGMEETLEQLSFKKFHSQPDNWKLFTRNNENNEFAALYKGKKGFIVQGQYSQIEVAQKDLEAISRHVLNEGWLLRSIRKEGMLPTLAYWGVALGNYAYGLLDPGVFTEVNHYFEAGNPSVQENTELLLSLVTILEGSVITRVGHKISSAMLNRNYASKLSKDAESYRYGKDAENRLMTELAFRKIGTEARLEERV